MHGGMIHRQVYMQYMSQYTCMQVYAIYYTTQYFLLPNTYFETSSIESTIHITTGEKDDNTIYMNVIVCQKTKSKRQRKDIYTQFIYTIYVHECTLLFVKICVSKTLFCQKRKIREMHFPLQATLHVGDEIREINGISVANQVCDEKITLSMHYNVPLHIYNVTIMHIQGGQMAMMIVLMILC